MSRREELALETQLLLQEVSLVTQRHQTEAIVDQAGASSVPVSEYEAAKAALVDKLRRKKETKRQQMQQVNQRRFGVGALPPQPSAIVTHAVDAPAAEREPLQLLSPSARKIKISPLKQRSMMKLPVAASAGAASRKQKDMLSKLRTQAIEQGTRPTHTSFCSSRPLSSSGTEQRPPSIGRIRLLCCYGCRFAGDGQALWVRVVRGAAEALEQD